MIAGPEDTAREGRFREIWDRTWSPVRAYVLRRADAADAEEVLSDTFVVVWRRLDDVPEGESTLPWVYSVARQTLANRRRGNRRRDALRSRLGEARRPVTSVEQFALAADEGRTVLGALARLRPDDQELLRLVAWEELPHAQIGVILGCSEKAVAVRLHRARSRLRVELGKPGRSSGQKQGRNISGRATKDEPK